jgi:ABC-type transport system involved in cytochrome c biogenesis permease subunit
LISELKLGDKGIEKSGLRYYPYTDLKALVPEIFRQAGAASKVESAQQTTYQKQVLKLANGLSVYQRLKNSIQPEGTTNYAAVLADFQAALPAGLQAFRDRQMGGDVDQAVLDKLMRDAGQFETIANQALPRVLPPQDPVHKPEDWTSVGGAVLETLRGATLHPAVGIYGRLGTAYQQGQAEAFNQAIAEYRTYLAGQVPEAAGKGRAEYYFNRAKFFLHATIIYICAFLLAGTALLTFGSWPNAAESFRRSAYYLIGLAFLVHTGALIYRMVLEGRPPVTNLYSSAIFIGWGTCALGLVLERIYKVGLGSAMAGLSGFITLLIAHNLALGGDTMEMMRAVLDTNFWLATHVVVVTLGYSATFVAGILGIKYILLGVFTPALTMRLNPAAANAAGVAAAMLVKTDGSSAKTMESVRSAAGRGELGNALAKMVYGIVCFAALFSFTGTVLGGIWADQSWGRFWGWDPKENGALLIVIWNALILHARWGGLVRERGLMNLAIFGNVITAWSWFGTNMLGIGLHSYGFMDAGFKWLMLFVGSQLAIIFLGLLPLPLWRSFRPGEPLPTKAPATA